MPLTHNAPQTQVLHLNMLNGSVSATVTKNFIDYAGLYQVCVAYNISTLAATSTVQVQPYADPDHSAVGTAIDFAPNGGSADGTVTIAAATSAQVEYSGSVFIPYGAKVTFATTVGTGTGSGTIDVFFRLEG